MKINDFHHESVAETERKIENASLRSEHVSKEWLHAQLLFRGFGRPDHRESSTKIEMRSYLHIMNKILEDKYCIVSICTTAFPDVP
jgi:hypothetical protein